jgi:hypothetical protein
VGAVALVPVPKAHIKNMSILESGINVFIVVQVLLGHAQTALQKNINTNLVKENVVIVGQALLGLVQKVLQVSMSIDNQGIN